MIRLGTRLEAIQSHVNCKTLADIGCDHGKLGVACLLQGRAEKLIATDISSRSLKKTENLCKSYKLTHKSECRQGDGFNAINLVDKVDCAVIAGLGGNEISCMLCDATVMPNKLIMSPHSHAETVREVLGGMNYKIEHDYTLFADKHFYDIIVAVRGVSEPLSDLQMEFGKDFATCSDFQKRATYNIKKLTKIREGLDSRNYGKLDAQVKLWEDALSQCVK